ncbi:MAG: methyltransferase domain-containing protein [Desulfobacteraceae bacterium]|nr:methyltransferase domain-containing protein [Desulfobacteraceae bacterium]
MSINEKLFDQLFCPECHMKVCIKEGANLLYCRNCDFTFEIRNSIPIMLSPDRIEQFKDDVDNWRENELIPGFISYQTVQLLKSPAPFKWFGKDNVLKRICDNITAEGLYLDIGGVGRFHPRILNINISPSADTDLVCEGQCLPFDDDSVDGIFILLVLEHVPDPQAITKEISRVLKPGGFVFATLPFLQVMHANPRDYYRFTPDGIRELFTGLNELELKIASGPTGTLLWILKAYIALFFPFSNYSLVYVSVREIIGWLLYPMIVFDFYLNRKKRAEKMASYFYYHGQKKHSEHGAGGRA